MELDDHNEHGNEFYNWLDENVKYKKNGYLPLKQIFSLYFKDNTNVDVKILKK